MDELYDISGMKCVWGIKSYDDLSGSSEASLYTIMTSILYIWKTKRNMFLVLKLSMSFQKRMETKVISIAFLATSPHG